MGEGGDQRPVPEVADRPGRNGIVRFPPCVTIEHRFLVGLHHVLRPALHRGVVGWHHLTGDQPVEQHADRGELLRHVRWRDSTDVKSNARIGQSANIKH